MPFIEGQWQSYGTGLNTSLWRAANPPVDPYKTMANGTVVLAGQTVLQASNSVGPPTALWAYAAGGAYDTDRERFISTQSSGHAASGSNEVNEFIVSTGTWVRQMDPTIELLSPQLQNWPANIALFGIHLGGPLALIDINNRYPANVSPATGGGGNLYPNTSQQYGCVCYMPAPYHKFWTSGGVSNWDPNFGQSIIFEYDVLTKKWQAQYAERNTWGGTAGGGSGFPGGAVWDSTYQRVLFHDYHSIYEYDPGKTPGTRVTILVNNFNVSTNLETTAVWDPVRKRLLLFGGDDVTHNGALGTYYDFAAGRFSPSFHAFSWSVGAYPGANWQGPGVFYDPLRDRYIYARFDGTRTLISIHPDNFVATNISPTSGTSPAPLTHTSEHMFGRFFYVASQDLYVALVNATDASAYVYKPTPVVTTPPPVLVATDILSGPRTGNSDTAFGQVMNQDGAYVTVYGFNFGNPEDTLTATLGGVAMRVIDRGQATGQRSPATLYNQYMTLQMAVLQVPAGAPLGASVLAITVNGQAAISPDLTFTVIPGTIRFVATAGLLQSVFDGMASGDITYVKDNVSLSTLFLRANTQNPSGQLALVAYPSAAVVLGNSSNDGISIDAGGAGGNCTFAKLNIRGANVAGAQAVTVRENGRIVGCNIQVPGGNGKAGAVGMFGSNLRFLANECTNCGSGPPADSEYHVVYRSGRRDVAAPFRAVESGFRAAYNYMHGNAAARAFNCFNDNYPSNLNCNPIGDHEIDHNVIVDQQYAGIGFLVGVVGTNTAHDNLLIRCGLAAGDGQGITVDLRARYCVDWAGATAPITLTFEHNTFFNCGDPTGAPNGVFYIIGAGAYSLAIRNNIIYQLNGFPYVASGSDALGPNASLRSHNLWFGAGAPPAFDSAALNVDPLVRSVTTPLDLHLQATSPARAAGLVIGAGSFDLDGRQRPATAPDLGAYQFGVGGIITPPPTPTASLALVFNGLTVDRVGQGGAALAPDGTNDGVVAVTLTTSDGNPKTVIALAMASRTPAAALIGQWDTHNGTVTPGAWVLGAALTPSAALLNQPTSMAVNFTVASGGTFVVIGSDAILNFSVAEFAAGTTLTVTATCSDGATATGSVVIGAGPPPPTLASLNPSTGPAGTQVTLLGSNFSGIPGGNTVRFGTTPATIVSEGVSAIVVLAPPLPDATYLVTVTTADGTSNGLPFQEVTLVGAGHGYPAVRTRYRRWS